MSASPPTCRSVSVFAFRGDRTRPFVTTYQKALNDARNGLGPGPTAADCIFIAGHTGVSIDGGTTIYGFNPDPAGLPPWQLMQRLKQGNAFPGVVRDDTSIFSAALNRSLTVASFDIVFPEPEFHQFEQRLDAERQSSKYSYGFPDGDGDCNCATWLERLGLPLLTGNMDELLVLRGISLYSSRRFGQCI